MSVQKFLASATVTAIAATTAISSASAASFPDLKETSVYYDSVQALVEKGVINGYPDGTFKPNQTIMREHAAIMFVRALQLEVPGNAVELLQSYSDVNNQTKNADKIAAMLGAEILTGQEGAFQPKEALTREVMATWIVRAFDLEEKPNSKAPFIDMDQVAPEHRKSVEILYQHGITNGNTDGTFAPKEGVTRAQFATFFDRGFTQQASTIAEVQRVDDIIISVGGKVQLPQKATVVYEDGTKGEAAVEWNNSSIDTSKEGKHELTGTIKGTSEKAYVTVYVENEDLEIEDVESTNLKQIELTFNHTRFDGGHPENLTYYELKDTNDKEVELLDARLAENKLILTLKEPVQEKLELIVDKAITGEEEDFSITLRDTTPPEVESVKAVAEDILQVEFSEPMNFKTENGKEVTNRDIEDALDLEKGPRVREVTVYEHGKVANIEFSSKLSDNQSYTLTVEDELRDYFGFKVEQDEFDFKVEYDKSSPQLVEVKNLYPNKATLVFDKDIKLANTRYIEGYFHHTDRGIDAATVTLQNRHEVVVTFDDKDPIPADGELIVDSGALEDLWGHENQSIRKKVSLQDDNTPPSVKSVKMVDEKKASSTYVQFEIIFDEPVKEELAEDKRNYELVNAKGNDIYLKNAEVVDTNTSEFKVLLTIDQRYGEFSNGEYTLFVDNMEDLYENESKELTLKFEAGSIAAPSEFEGSMIWDDDEEEVIFVINYGREMAEDGAYSVASLDKYELTVEDQTFLLETLEDEDNMNVDINAYNKGEKVEIILSQDDELEGNVKTFYEDLAAAAKKKDLDDLSLVVGRVADADGNKTTSFANKIKLDTTGSFGVKDDKVKMVDETTLELVLEDIVYDFEEDDFIVFADEDRNGRYSSKEEIDIDDVELDNDDVTVTITLDDKLDSDGTYDGDKVYITTDSTTYTKNRFGQKLKFDTLGISDSVAPAIREVKGEDQVFVHEAIGESDKAVISMEFTDDLDARTVTRLSFDVGDGRFEVISAYVDDEMIYLVVDLDKYDLDDLVGEYIEQKAPITDLNNNLIKNLDIKIVDKGDRKDIDDLD